MNSVNNNKLTCNTPNNAASKFLRELTAFIHLDLLLLLHTVIDMIIKMIFWVNPYVELSIKVKNNSGVIWYQMYRVQCIMYDGFLLRSKVVVDKLIPKEIYKDFNKQIYKQWESLQTSQNVGELCFN